MIGFAGYFHVNPAVASAEVGIVIGDTRYWGRGYGREALTLLVRHLFTDLAMQRVHLQTWSGNERAIHSYHAVGFREEGRLRRAQVVDGRYYDTVLMGLLREEFAHAGYQVIKTQGEEKWQKTWRWQYERRM